MAEMQRADSMRKIVPGRPWNDDDVLRTARWRFRTQTLPWRATARMAAVQAYREATRNVGQFVLGLSVVFVIVVILAVLFTALHYAPLIFLSVSEAPIGEVDMFMTANKAKANSLLNLSMVDDILLKSSSRSSSPLALYSARKYISNVLVYLPASCTGFNSADIQEPTYPYTGMPLRSNATLSEQQMIDVTRQACNKTPFCLSQLCSQSASSVTLVLMDSLKEREMAVGREWTLPNVPVNSLYLQSNLADDLNVKLGDIVFVNIPFYEYFKYQHDIALRAAEKTINKSLNIPWYANQQISLPLTIADVFVDTLGKVNDDWQSVAFMEYPSFFTTIINHLHPEYEKSFINALQLTSPRSYIEAVSDIIFTYPPPRTNGYLESDYVKLSQKMLAWGNDIVLRLGIGQVTVSLPVLKNLSNLRQITSFLNLLLSLVVVVLSTLGVFLIYSLLMVSVETKVFEFGIFRMIGATRPSVLMLLLAMSYTIPALIFGLLVSQGAFIYLSTMLQTHLRIVVSPYLTLSAVVAAFVVALIVPPLASLLPIRKALTYNLHDSLDRGRGTTKLTHISIERSKTQSVDPMVAIVGLTLFFLGFGIYYFLPLSLLTNDLALLFNIFLIILIGMISGMVVVSMNFLPLVERMLIATLFTVNVFESTGVQSILQKNLLVHRPRNKKTSLLYSLALGFVIFLTVMTDVEVSSMQFNHRRSYGTELLFQSNAKLSNGYTAPFSAPEEIESFIADHPLIEAYAWSTQALDGITPNIVDTNIYNVGKVQKYQQRVFGISPNFFEVMDNDFLQLTRYDTSVPYTPAEQLYSVKGYSSAIASAYYQESLLLQSFIDRFTLGTTFNTKPLQTEEYTYLQSMSLVKLAPLLDVTEFPSDVQDMAISLQRFLTQLAGDTTITSILDIPLRTIFIRLRPGISDRDYYALVRTLRAKSQYEYVLELRQLLKGSNETSDALRTVFDIVTVLVMIITFFSLNTSMYVNILEQKKEIAIMRSLGFSRPSVLRLYFYEALIVVLSSSLLGVRLDNANNFLCTYLSGAIGSMIAWTITAQRTILTGTPIQFLFPWRTTVIVIVLSVLCSFFATIGPVQALVFRKKLVTLLKE